MDNIPLPTISDIITHTSPSTVALVCCVATVVSLYILFLCSCYEYSLYSLSRKELSQIVNSRSDEYQSLKLLLKDPEKTLSHIIAGYYCAAVVAIVSISLMVVMLCSSCNLPAWAHGTIGAAGLSLLLILLVGDMLPSLLKQKKRLHLLYLFSSQMRVAGSMFSPLAEEVHFHCKTPP